MPRLTNAVQIDLRFSDQARKSLNFGVRAHSSNFERQRFHLSR
jgi:hypothetical protein